MYALYRSKAHLNCQYITCTRVLQSASGVHCSRSHQQLCAGYRCHQSRTDKAALLPGRQTGPFHLHNLSGQSLHFRSPSFQSLWVVCSALDACLTSVKLHLCRLPAILPCWDHCFSTLVCCHCSQDLAKPAAVSRAFVAAFSQSICLS